jgi:hypothetical protein
MEGLRRLRVFVSSPGDVDAERERIDLVAGRLNASYAELVKLETIRWETEFYSSHRHFQEAIPDAADCDIVVALFHARLGTPLPPTFRMDNGERYPSGTAYEVLTAIEARRKGERPDVFVFRKDCRPDTLSEDQKTQWRDLNGFFSRWFQTPDGEYLRAYHRFATSDEFEGLIERLLKKWIEDNVPRDRSLVWPIETKGSPFRALQPFDAKHAAIYFGRDRKVTRAIEQLQSVALPVSSIRSAPKSVPFLLICGESGAGKSSLMRAGLAPRLTSPGVTPQIDLWRIAVARIGDESDPFLTLAKALLVEKDEIGGFGRALPELRAFTAGDPAALLARGGCIGARRRAVAAPAILAALRTVQDAEATHRKSLRRLRANLLLLVDQLENIFAATVSEDTRAAFATLLFGLAATRRVWIVSTIRSDLYPRLLVPGPFLALKDAGAVYDLAAPGESELSEIIHRSAAAAGLVYETDARTGERLDERILGDARGKNTLPLLQFALDSLFENRETTATETRLTFDAYRKLGGLDGAIDRSAEAALATLGPAEQEALPRLLRSLAIPVDETTKSSASELTARTLPYAALTRRASDKRLVDALVGARIVIVTAADSEAGERTEPLLSIAHQRVFESWQRARSIVAAHRDFFRIREEVERQYRRWIDSGRRNELLLVKGVPLAEAQTMRRDYDEELSDDTRAFIKASTRRAQRLNIFLGATAASFFVIAVVALYFQQNAQKNFRVATETASNVVTSFAKGLVDVKGVGVTTVDNVLKEVNLAFDRLWADNPNDRDLKRGRAAMFYQFAKNYENLKAGLDNARKMAGESLALRQQLTGDIDTAGRIELASGRPLSLWWELAESLELVGDIDRRQQKVEDARRHFDAARRLMEQAVALAPGNVDYPRGLSGIYTRIGDIALAGPKPNYADAEANYAALMRADATYYLRQINAQDWQREMTWAFMKSGDLEVRKVKDKAPSVSPRASAEAAIAAYTNALCLRETLMDENADNLRFRRDVAFTFEKLSDAELILATEPGTNAAAAAHLRKAAEDALIDSLRIRFDLADTDRLNVLYRDDVAALDEKLARFYRTIRPPTHTPIQNEALALAFYEAALDERRRSSELGADDAQVHQRLVQLTATTRAYETAAKADGALPASADGWWQQLVASTRNRTTPDIIASRTTCLADVAAAARTASAAPAGTDKQVAKN